MQQKSRGDNITRGLLNPVSKGKRLFIIHAGREAGVALISVNVEIP
jgi:hypothetical protein